MYFCRACSITLDSIAIIADSETNSSGGFVCSSLSSISIDAENSVDISSASIDIACNVMGAGDLLVSCGNGCDMAVGGDSNPYSLTVNHHLSNTELRAIETTGNVVIGSESDKNVTQIRIDGAIFQSSASTVTFVASQGSISFVNTSTSFHMDAMSAQLSFVASQNITIESAVVLNISSSGAPMVTFVSDLDCSVSDFDHFAISSIGSVHVETIAASIFVIPSAVDISGELNITGAPLLEFRRTFLAVPKICKLLPTRPPE